MTEINPVSASAAVEKSSSPMVPAVVRVRDFRRETADTFTLFMDAPPGYRFLPGQFNMLYVFGVGEAAISLSGDPAERGTLVHTIRSVGSVTGALARMKAGDSLGVRGPFGSAWPVDQARGRDIVMVAGGIGLPPLRPVIYELLRQRQDVGQMVLLYGVRTPADLVYAAEIEEWRKRGALRVLVTVDQGDPSWRGAVGLVTALFSQIQVDPARTLGLTCGPEVMMRFAAREFAKIGVGADRVHVSLERNMQCAVGFCGHCQFGPEFICLDGPVFRYDRVQSLLATREV